MYGIVTVSGIWCSNNKATLPLSSQPASYKWQIYKFHPLTLIVCYQQAKM